MVRNKTLLGLGAVVTAAVTLASTGSALADLAPTKTDAVGIGSDTVQNIGNFLADGDNKGNAGYNATGPKNRLVSFDATPDANDRAGFLNGSTLAAQLPLNPTIVLRQGLQPVLRPNGSGSGVAALLLDGADHNIDFVRMSRLPSTAEQNTATGNAGVGALRVIRVSTDALNVAVSSTTNAPVGASALTGQQIADIYGCKAGARDWNSFNPSAPVGSTIVPEIPQAGSGTGDTFRKDLKALNNGVDVVLTNGCVVTVEENDPSSLNTNPNAIAPFSAGRKNLYDAGYFNDPSKKYGTPQTKLTSGIQQIATAAYNDVRGLYIVFRDSDVASTTKFQPGSALNKVQDLFYNPGNVGGVVPFVQNDLGTAAITAAGSTPAYKDCGAGANVVSC